MSDHQEGSDSRSARDFTAVKQGESGAVLSLRLAAPREQVFDAMTGCEHLPHWMGAAGRNLVGCSAELRAGGSYRHEFAAPNQRRFVVHGAYLDVTRPERVVHSELYEGYDWPAVTVTTDLAEVAGQTSVTLTIEYPTQAIRDEDFPNLEHSLAGYRALQAYLHRL